MKKFCILLCSSVLYLTSAQASASDIRKDINEYAGIRCNTPKKGSNIALGFFSGLDEATMISDDGYTPIDRMRCFKIMSECEGWLYTMQSRYGVPPPRIARCTQY